MTKEFDPMELKNAVTAVGTAFEEFKKTNDERIAQIESKGVADPLTTDKLTAIEGTMQKSQERLDAFELAVKRQNRTSIDANGAEVDLEAKARAWFAPIAKRNGTDAAAFGHAEMDAYKSAFGRFLRKDDRVITGIEQKALSVGSDPDGGYMVNPDMTGQIVRQVYETSEMRAYASIQTIGTDTLEGGYDNDEAGAEWVGEVQIRSETDTPQLGMWRIPVHELSAKPKVTQKLLDDGEFNVEGWLTDKIAQQFSRKENTAFVSGDGIAKPFGFLSYAESSDLTLGIEQFDTGVNGAFAAAPSGGDVLIDALYGLKAQYRAMASWFMNRGTLKVVRKLKDSDGAYLWAPGIAAGQPSQLMGYPLATFEDMPSPATGSLSIAVGDMRAAYQIVDRAGIRVLRDPYTDKPKVCFYSTKRVGGGLINGEALKLIAFKS
jgi:HK97 family phage major capsid protein